MFSWLFDPRADQLGAELLSLPADRWTVPLSRASARRQVEGLVYALERTAEPDRTVALLRELASRDPGAAFRWVAVAWEADDLPLVEEIAAGALRDWPGHVQAAEDLIRVWIRRGELDRAKRLLARAPAEEPVYQLLEAQVRAAEGDVDGARALVETVCARAYQVLVTLPAADTYWREVELRAIRLRDELAG